ncbi:MAG: hypothetical protein ACEQSB_00745 [Undibacterium sp.]
MSAFRTILALNKAHPGATFSIEITEDLSFKGKIVSFTETTSLAIAADFKSKTPAHIMWDKIVAISVIL